MIAVGLQIPHGPGDDEENDYSEWSIEDLQYKSEIDEDALAELNERTGDEWYPDGRDDE